MLSPEASEDGRQWNGGSSKLCANDEPRQQVSVCCSFLSNSFVAAVPSDFRMTRTACARQVNIL
jgi:hypothetical protein